MKRFCLVALGLLVACGTPQEQCIARNTRDLRVVDRLIAETQGNLKRGYAIETVTVSEDYWGYCEQVPLPDQPPLPPRLCLKDRDRTVERAKAIDLAEEGRKLDSLTQKRAELAAQAKPVIAQCKAEHAE
jgi:hypothetical protein